MTGAIKMINALHHSRDNVINSAFLSGYSTYEFALQALYPLLDRFGEQRKAQNKKFYDRLRRDIIIGCVMPPVTLAFVSEEFSKESNIEKLSSFVNENIDTGYILDGMQRLITLRDAAENDGFDKTRHIYINVIIAERYDLLLYRMITLNNGQKPMTARHQIEMLTKGVIDISGVDMEITREKQTEGTKISFAFKMSDIAEAYTAYLSDSLHNQNSKIIESKLDEILVGKVMDSDVTDEKYSFAEILGEVGRLQVEVGVRDWLRQLNNLIGFTVGAKRSLSEIQKINPADFLKYVDVFEKSFDSINPSKVNVGKYRRELSKLFIEKISTMKDYAQEELEAIFFNETMAE